MNLETVVRNGRITDSDSKRTWILNYSNIFLQFFSTKKNFA